MLSFLLCSHARISGGDAHPIVIQEDVYYEHDNVGEPDLARLWQIDAADGHGRATIDDQAEDCEDAELQGDGYHVVHVGAGQSEPLLHTRLREPLPIKPSTNDHWHDAKGVNDEPEYHSNGGKGDA